MNGVVPFKILQKVSRFASFHIRNFKEKLTPFVFSSFSHLAFKPDGF